MNNLSKLMNSLRAAVNKTTARKNNVLFRYVMECTDDGTGDCPPQSVGACCCLDQVTGTISCNDIMYTPPQNQDPNNPPPNPCGNDTCTFYPGKSCGQDPCVMILTPVPSTTNTETPVAEAPFESEMPAKTNMGM